MRQALVALLIAVTVAGCGAPSHIHHAQAAAGCPKAALGHGHMGACTPPAERRFGAVAPQTLAAHPTYPDLSNNDPASCAQLAAIKHAGHPGVYLKVNEATAFVDRTFAPMAACARRLGLAVGGYDFVRTYSTAEAGLFVRLLWAAGMTRTAARWFPPTLDVEAGAATRGGVLAMARVVRAAFGRVNVYTGNWYWSRLGCFWPAATTAWLSGYPVAPVPCGLPLGLYHQHQYTNAGWNGAFSSDMTIWTGTAAGFHAFAQLPSPAPLTPGQRKRKLRALVAWRAHLRRVLARYGCRHGVKRHQTQPVNCLLTLRRGDAANRRIKELSR